MRTLGPVGLWTLGVLLPFGSAPAVAQTQLQYVDSDPTTGNSAAVVVADSPLIHTAQLLPTGESGKIVSTGDVEGQIDRLFERLESVLRRAGGRMDLLVKLNFYVARQDLGDVVRTKLAARVTTEARPAVSLVVSALPDREALVAVDTVAAVKIGQAGTRLPGEAAILPAGSRLYVSGQAEPGTLREATRKTLESLTATLQHGGRTDADVVQLKCFLTPMQAVAEAREEIARYYGPERMPPVSFVEWRSSLPIEIELVAGGGRENVDAVRPIEYLTPPALKASPLYSRVARILRGGTIYLSDLHAAEAASADDQARQSFQRLGNVLAKAGSNCENLVKATYYVADDEIGKAHNAIRPKFFDPRRPPAASKALVAGTGRPGVRYVMDMIAAPGDEIPKDRDNAKILFIGKEPDHPYGSHMYLHSCQMLAQCVELKHGVQTIVASGWPDDPAKLKGLAAIVVYTSPAAELLLDGPQRDQVAELMKRGVGLVTIHWASSIKQENLERLGPTWLGYLGGTWVSNVGLGGGKSLLKQVEPKHPICRGWDEFEIDDEYYLNPTIKDAAPLLSVREKGGKDVVVAWTYDRPGGGRSFATTLGHPYRNFQDARFRRMIVNGIRWAAHIDVPQDGSPVEIGEEALALPPQP